MQQKDKFCTTKAGCRKQSFCNPDPARKRLNRKGPLLCLNTSEPAKQIRALEAVFTEPAPENLRAALREAQEAEQASKQACEAHKTPANEWGLELAKARKEHIRSLVQQGPEGAAEDADQEPEASALLPPSTQRHEEASGGAEVVLAEPTQGESAGDLARALRQAVAATRARQEAWNAHKTPENARALELAEAHKERIVSQIFRYQEQGLERSPSLYEAHRGSGGASGSSSQAPRIAPSETPSLQEGPEGAARRADQEPEASARPHPSTPHYEEPSGGPGRSPAPRTPPPATRSPQQVFDGDAKRTGQESGPSTLAAPSTPQYEEPPGGARDDSDDESSSSFAFSPVSSGQRELDQWFLEYLDSLRSERASQKS